jgi:transcriptional regulator with XRE-family HTH domain
VVEKTKKTQDEAGDISKILGVSIRKQRQLLGKTIQEVATETSLSTGFVSQVERGMCAPSLTSFYKIAKALDTSMEALLETPETYNMVTRKTERTHYNLGDKRRTYELLGPGFKNAAINACLVHRPAGHMSEEFSHEGEEFIFLLEGEADYFVDGEWHHLCAGDTIHFESSKTHKSKVTSENGVVEISVCTMPIYQR